MIGVSLLRYWSRGGLLLDRVIISSPRIQDDGLGNNCERVTYHGPRIALWPYCITPLSGHRPSDPSGLASEDLYMGPRSVVLCEHSILDTTYAIDYVTTALSDDIVELAHRGQVL